MQSAIEAVRHVLSVDAPTVFKLLGNSLLELDEKVKELEAKKQDKTDSAAVEIPAGSINRGGLQQKLWKVLSGAGAKEEEVAKKIYIFLASLE
jgi:hypothetical protein